MNPPRNIRAQLITFQANGEIPHKKKPIVDSYLWKQKPSVDSYLPRNGSPDPPMEIHVELEASEVIESLEHVEPQKPEEPLCFFHKGPNGELLGGNADAYRALGFGWVDADDPTRAKWAEFCKTGFDCSGMPDYPDIIEKHFPNWRTEKRPPRSRSRSRTRTPPSNRRSSTPENPLVQLIVSSL